jgi:hypothetical protein
MDIPRDPRRAAPFSRVTAYNNSEVQTRVVIDRFSQGHTEYRCLVGVPLAPQQRFAGSPRPARSRPRHHWAGHPHPVCVSHTEAVIGRYVVASMWLPSGGGS